MYHSYCHQDCKTTHHRLQSDIAETVNEKGYNYNDVYNYCVMCSHDNYTTSQPDLPEDDYEVTVIYQNPGDNNTSTQKFYLTFEGSDEINTNVDECDDGTFVDGLGLENLHIKCNFFNQFDGRKNFRAEVERKLYFEDCDEFV